MEHYPFRLILRMQSPVVLTDFAPTLDAVLFAAMQDRYCKLKNEELRHKMRNFLTWNDQLGVFHGSSMMFAITPDVGLIAKTHYRVDVHSTSKRSSNMMAPSRPKIGQYRSFILAGGPEKKRLNSYPAYSAPYVVFDGHGDGKAVRDMLSYFFVGIGYDAQNCGMGSFSDEIELLTLPDDRSLVVNGNAMRPLPMDAAIGHAATGSLIPPYFDKTIQTTVVRPERVRVAPYSQFLIYSA